jgi:hypothetical protein
MRPDEKNARTYYDLMRLLPDVAKIKLWWKREPDGPPMFIDRVALSGHDGSLLLEAVVDDVEKTGRPRLGRTRRS